MRMILSMVLLVAVAGCGGAPPAQTSKEQTGPKVTNGKNASGVGLAEEGH